EAAVVGGIEVFGVRTLDEVVGLLTGMLEAEPAPPADVDAMLAAAEAEVDFAEVRGQESVKRALLISAAGGHNCVMIGPAGSGKTMMAKAFAGILPRMSASEAIEVTRIYSAAGMLAPGEGLVTARPVRSPHHTASPPAIVGGGMVPRPGEISLAHRGVLFLDEMPEFPRTVLETLRQPMEDQTVTISRAHGSTSFPADFTLIAAMNPTPRGDIAPGEVGKREMERYMGKLSGPLLDRIDIHIEAPAVPYDQLRNGKEGTGSAEMRQRAHAARARQAERQGDAIINARLTGKQLDSYAPMEPAAEALLGRAVTELGLCARAFTKVRRIARTIADLDQRDTLGVGDIAEAVQYRLLDRKT
ncbi:MAG: YifB family Mg chelatase-like AAA ATPase, partial [Planctomycetota bacterium]